MSASVVREDPTPAQELRDAAKKLRKVAAGPMECIGPIRDGDADEWTKYYGDECPDLPDGDGPWITLMTPKLAEPLAALFESAADFLGDAVGTPPSGYPLTYALQAALLILGRSS